MPVPSTSNWVRAAPALSWVFPSETVPVGQVLIAPVPAPSIAPTIGVSTSMTASTPGALPTARRSASGTEALIRPSSGLVAMISPPAARTPATRSRTSPTTLTLTIGRPPSLRRLPGAVVQEGDGTRLLGGGCRSQVGGGQGVEAGR